MCEWTLLYKNYMEIFALERCTVERISKVLKQHLCVNLSPVNSSWLLSPMLPMCIAARMDNLLYQIDQKESQAQDNFTHWFLFQVFVWVERLQSLVMIIKVIENKIVLYTMNDLTSWMRHSQWGMLKVSIIKHFILYHFSNSTSYKTFDFKKAKFKSSQKSREIRFYFIMK